MNQVIANIVLSSALWLLLALAVSIQFQPTRFLNLSTAFAVLLGPYGALWIGAERSSFLVIACLGSALLAAVFGVAAERCMYFPLRRMQAPSWVLMVASLGLLAILQPAIALIFGENPQTLRHAPAEVGHSLFGAYLSGVQLAIIGIALTLFLLTLALVKWTRYGRLVRAVSSNSELCAILGIRAERVTLWAVAVGSFLAAAAGILSGLDTHFTPAQGFRLLINGMVAMIIGGVGSVGGMIVGACVLASAQHLSAYFFDSKWMDGVTFAILIGFLIWKPLGFSGRRLKKVEA